MKSTDRMILVAVAVLGLLAAFWFAVIAPKRAEVSDLDTQVSELRENVATAEQQAALAEQAKDGYGENYHRLVVLGKAVPAEEETSSLLVQVQALAAKSGVAFDSIELSATGATDQTTAPAAQQTTADSGTGGTQDATTTADQSDTTATDSASASAPVSAPATEAAAASLPLGATVGPAGLPVMPYDLHFRGDFFAVANFIKSLDALVSPASKQIGVDGRLLTVDGFAFGPDEVRGFPHLVANLHVTTYVAPADQGVTAGATPTTPPTAVPTATTDTATSTATPTSATTP